MEQTNFATLCMLVFGILGVIGIIAWMATMTQNKDNGAEIRKNLSIIGGISGGLIFAFGIVAYNYFSINVNYLTPFLFVLSFINLFLSLFAISAATLQIVS